jgi:hypothetical protein
MGLGWICERELRGVLGGRPLHLPDGVVLSTDTAGKVAHRRGGGADPQDRGPRRRHPAPPAGDLRRRRLPAHPSAMTVVTRSAAALRSGASDARRVRELPAQQESDDRGQQRDHRRELGGPGLMGGSRCRELSHLNRGRMASQVYEQQFLLDAREVLGQDMLVICDFSPGPSWGFNGDEKRIVRSFARGFRLVGLGSERGVCCTDSAVGGGSTSVRMVGTSVRSSRSSRRGGGR